MADVVKSQQEIEKEELERNKKIKPVLANFVTKMQFDNAKKKALENKKIADEKLSNEEIKLQCARLSMRAFKDYRFWEKYLIPFDCAWITGRTRDGRIVSAEELAREMMVDIGSFSSYLLDEYYNNKGIIASGTYLHPLLENNLEFFWQKFVADLKAFIRVDQRRKNLGNQGIAILD